jgi:anti-sigma B factor antagonist
MDGAQFKVEAWDAQAQLLAVSGELDLTSVRDLRRRLERVFADGDPRIVVDLAGVTHMDSTGLAELISAHQRAMELEGRLILVVPSATIRRTFEIRGVASLFTLVETRDGARELLSAG